MIQLRTAVEEIVKKYQKSLFIAALNICKNKEDAEDAVQDTIFRYYDKNMDYEDEEHIKAWLFRVVINRAKDINRGFWKLHRASLEEYTDTISFPSQDSRDVFEAVMSLDKKYGIVVDLFYFEGYSVSEIAKLLRISESNVKVRLSRARKVLKGKLKERWLDE